MIKEMSFRSEKFANKVINIEMGDNFGFVRFLSQCKQRLVCFICRWLTAFTTTVSAMGYVMFSKDTFKILQQRRQIPK